MVRILAVLLVLLIGSPDCWCCVTERAPMQPAQGHSCCRAHGHDAPSSQEHPSSPCPCAHQIAKRGLANDGVVPPGAPVSTVPAAMFSWTENPAFAAVTATLVPRANPGPPHDRQAVFKRHCALQL